MWLLQVLFQQKIQLVPWKFVETFDIQSSRFPSEIPSASQSLFLGKKEQKAEQEPPWAANLWQEHPFALFVQHIAQQRLRQPLYSTIVTVIMRGKKIIWPSEANERNKPLTDPFPERL